MTSVAIADRQVLSRPAHSHTDSAPTPASADPRLATEPQIDCPACGLPATVEWRDMVAGTSGPVSHVKIRCPQGRHWFLMPEEWL